MCGITGFWNPARNNERELRFMLDRMLDVLDHRGPDDRGSRLYVDQGLALGHTRLSIIGLEELRDLALGAVATTTCNRTRPDRRASRSRGWTGRRSARGSTRSGGEQ